MNFRNMSFDELMTGMNMDFKAEIKLRIEQGRKEGAKNELEKALKVFKSHWSEDSYMAMGIHLHKRLVELNKE